MKLVATERGFRIGPVTNDEFKQIRRLAGSAHCLTIGEDTWVSIASNVYSLIRLKRFYPDLVIEVGGTAALVHRLKDRLIAWREENQLGKKALAGDFCFTPSGYVYKRKLFEHQLKIVNYLHAMNGQCAVFGDPGIGKTAAIAVWLDQLKFTGQLARGEAVIFTKPSIIDSAWMDDIKSFTGLDAISMGDIDDEEDEGMLKARRDVVKGKDWDVLVVGYELARIAKRAPGRASKTKSMPLRNLLVRHNFQCAVFDESTELKNHRSLNFRVARDVSANATAGRVPLTGTPAPNGPDDLWSQMYIVDRGMSLEPSVTDFRSQYYDEVALRGVRDRRGNNVITYKLRGGALEEVHDKIAPRAIRIKASECLDLPEIMPDVTRVIEMTPPQKRLYREMKDDLITQIEERQTTAFHAVVQIMKLRQITSGFLIPDQEDGEKDPIAIPGPNPKLLELDDLLAEIVVNNKALVFLQFRYEFRLMLERYKKYNPGAIYGATPKGKVGDIVREFQENSRTRVLFLHPDAAGYGLTLTAANYCVYYSLSYNSEEHTQSRARIVRPGQTKTMFFYYLLCKNSIDRIIYRALGHKRDVESLLVDGVRKLLEDP
jgi:SNF2 family DNA or RNA helicase